MPALVVFERVVSKSLKDGGIDEENFNMLQMLHLETLNELTGIDHRMEAEHRSLVEVKQRKKSLIAALCAILCVTLKNG